MNVIHVCLLLLISLAGTAYTRAVVIYTKLSPPVYRPFPDGVMESSTNYLIDLNQDGINDFNIVTTGFGMNCEAIGTNEIACGFIFGFPEIGGFAQTIHDGEVIGAYEDGLNYDWTPGFGAMIAINGITNPPLIYGYWGSNRDYLGVRFNIDGEFHYGWIQMYLPASEGAGFIEAFAYESEPNKAIIAVIPEPSIIVQVVVMLIPLLLRRSPANRKS